MFLKSILLASGAFVAMVSPVLAQTTTPSEASAQSEATRVEELIVTGSYTINERIDTATGLGLTLRETPQSVTVVTAQRILDQNMQTVADIVTNTVGVSGNQVDDVRNTFNARGFEIKNYQIDGVPTGWTLAGGAGETMADVSLYERVEIVRGATGLMTGAGDPSASINLVRKHATATELQGYVSGSLGSWNNRQIQADVAGPLTASGNIRGRAVAKYEKSENFIDWYKNEKSVLYGVIDADLTENTLLRVGGSQQKGAPNAPAWGALPTFFSDGTVAVWPRSKTASADWSYWDTTNQNVFANLQHKFSNGWSLSVNYNWARNAQTTELLYMSGLIDKATGNWLQITDPTQISAAFPYRDDGESIQNSVDIQLKGDYGLFGRQHEFVAGALHSKQHLTTDTFGADWSTVAPGGSFYDWTAIPHPTFSTTATPTVDQTIKQTGYYAATRLNVTDAFKVIAGARVASWSQKGFNYGTFDFGDDNVLVPYVGALYDISPNHRLYASYTEIFQPQNARDYTGAYLDPVTGESAEIGLKSAFFDERLQTTVAVFRIVQDNLAQIDPDATHTIPGDPLGTRASIAAKGATSEGFELEVIGKPATDWNVSFGYSQFEMEDAAGAKVNTAFPRKLLKLFTTYRLPGAMDGLIIGGGVNWQSSAYSVNAGSPFRFEQKSYALVSLMARYEINESLSVQANVENLSDKTYFAQTGFYSQYRYGQPRNYTVGLKYAF